MMDSYSIYMYVMITSGLSSVSISHVIAQHATNTMLLLKYNLIDGYSVKPYEIIT